MLDQSCWACANQRLGGVTITGKCSRNNEEIPVEIVDQGCPFWVEKELELPEEEI